MNIMILGGGIAGMLGAYALRKHKPTIVEAGYKLGGNFTAGGLKYIHDTQDIRKLLNELDVPFQPYSPRGAILIEGQVYNHPETLADWSPLRRYQVQHQHWRKTRAAEHGFREDCMNDPMGNHQALKCDHNLLLQRLEVALRNAGCDIRLGSKVESIGVIEGLGGVRGVTLDESLIIKHEPISISYDILVPTLPLGLLSQVAPWAKLPRAEATKLAIFDVAIEESIMKRLAWDYMYTPDLRWVSRIAKPEPYKLMVEVPWYLVQSDSAYNVRAFPEAAAPEVMNILGETILREHDAVCTGSRLIPGHLRPLESELVWPSGWYPLGRFAQWDSRATADKVYARALSIASSL